jgi:flagellar biosynthesis protein FlhF
MRERPVGACCCSTPPATAIRWNEVVHAYRRGDHADADLAGCIVTKVDEATHPGAVIDTVDTPRLPVHYVSSGQKVPEHLVLPQRP